MSDYHFPLKQEFDELNQLHVDFLNQVRAFRRKLCIRPTSIIFGSLVGSLAASFSTHHWSFFGVLAICVIFLSLNYYATIDNSIGSDRLISANLLYKKDYILHLPFLFKWMNKDKLNAFIQKRERILSQINESKILEILSQINILKQNQCFEAEDVNMLNDWTLMLKRAWMNEDKFQIVCVLINLYEFIKTTKESVNLVLHFDEKYGTQAEQTMSIGDIDLKAHL